MRLTIAAVGRLKAGPETDLVERYLKRLKPAGAALGLDFAGTIELPESRAASADERKSDEARRLLAAVPDRATIVVLDETGRDEGSRAFAAMIARMRDDGRRDLVLVIGGPDGLAAELRQAATMSLRFGSMTWPHQLVRVMLAEQLYRASMILAGHPYHRA